ATNGARTPLVARMDVADALSSARGLSTALRAGAAGSDLPPLPDVLRADSRKGKGTSTAQLANEQLRRCRFEGDWAKALSIIHQLRQEADLFHYNAAIATCSRLRQRGAVLGLRQEMLERQMLPDVYTYSALMRSADASTAQELLQEMHRRGLQRNVVISSAAMKALVRDGDWSSALRLFEAEANADCQLCTCALGAYGMGSCWAEAFQLLRDMPKRPGLPQVKRERMSESCSDLASSKTDQFFSAGHCVPSVHPPYTETTPIWGLASGTGVSPCRPRQLPPDLYAFNAGMSACAQAGQWEEAFWILENMDTRPELFSFNVVLHSLQQAKRWSQALQLFRDLPLRHALQPDTVSFNTLLQVLQPKLQMELLKEMYDSSVPRTARSYAVLMTGCWERAFSLLENCKQEGIEPTTELYGAAMKACSLSRQWRQAMLFLAEMKGAGLAVNNEVCGAAIGSCMVPFDRGERGEPWREALSFFEILKAEQKPNGVTYIALLSAFAGCSRWEEALQLVEQQTDIDERQAEHVKITNSAITACGRAIAWPQALHVFQETSRPTLVTYNALLYAFAEASEWSLALQVLHELNQKIVPNVVTLNSVLHALCTGSHHVAAQRLLGRMPDYGLTADLYSYTTVMSACTSVSCWEMTCDLLTTMMSKQIDPDMHSVNNVISALASGPKWQEAFHMFSNIDQFRLAPDHVTHSTLIAQRMRAAVEEAQRAQLVTGVVGL
ncbi:unnamed protein product, partial [Durusdinium trenchii]